MAMFLFMLTQNYEMALVSFYQGFRITLSAVDILKLLTFIRRRASPAVLPSQLLNVRGCIFPYIAQLLYAGPVKPVILARDEAIHLHVQ